MAAQLTIDGAVAELRDDGHGLTGHVEIDGVRHRVFATVTACGTQATTPAKWARQ